MKHLASCWGDTPVPYLLLDRKGKISSANQAAESLLQEDLSELQKGNVSDFFDSQLPLQSRMRTRRKDRLEKEIEGTLRTRGGKEIPVSVRLQRLAAEKGTARYLLWIRDDSELHELRRRLERSEKLSAVAIVAGKVVHEIRSPLNSIFLNNDLLQERVEKMRGPQAQKVRRYLHILQEEVDRLNEVVGSYLSLTHLAGSDRQVTAVDTFLQDFISEIRDDYSRRQITIATVFRSRRRRLSLNQRQFRRVLLNLFANSRDAMIAGGIITVSTEDTVKGFRITVSDTGEGIPSESLLRLTTPFTSYKSNGTGLGLYLAREIVEHHEGHLDIRSLQGEGTSVIISLPTSRRT